VLLGSRHPGELGGEELEGWKKLRGKKVQALYLAASWN
jgi:hypothetical protein